MSAPPRTPQFVTPLRFPAAIDNRPSLPRIGYRIGAYADVRLALLRGLDLDPVLAGWTHREPDDPGIALLEGAAILVDILTFYQELYANEAFLRTATWRDSVADLVKLLGYRLSPGVGGNATFAFSVRGDAPVTVPAGFPIKADLAGQPSVDFETGSQPAIVYPWLGQFNLFAPQQKALFDGKVTQLVITTPGDQTQFKPGDRLLVGKVQAGTTTQQLTSGDDGGEPQIVIVDSVRAVHGQTVLMLKAPLPDASNADELSVYRLGRSFRHFGYNAPKQDITLGPSDGTNADSKIMAIPVNIQYYRQIDGDTASGDFGNGETTIVSPTLDAKEFPLDAQIDNLAQGAPIVIQFARAPTGTIERYSVVGSIANLRGGTMTWGGLTGSTTFVTLADPIRLMLDEDDRVPNADIQQTRLHEVTSPPLAARPLPLQLDTSTNDTLYIDAGVVPQYATILNQSIYLATQQNLDPEIATVVKIDDPGADPLNNFNLVPLKIKTAKGIAYALYPYESPVVTVFGNLVDATQGKTEKLAALGNGDATQTFQTFKLPKAPLTYLLPDGAARPGVVQATVRVAGVEWTNVDSLYGQGPNAQVYVVRQDQDGNSYVQFGDGLTGARLPSGVGNVTTLFRTGVGSFGPIKKGATPSAGARLDPLQALVLIGDATGGAPPEGGDQARVAAPGRVQSMGRLVSLQDFETEARAIPDVALVAARWDLADGVPSVVVTMLLVSGGANEFKAAQAALVDASRCRGADRFPVVVNRGFYAYVYLTVSVATDPELDPDAVFAQVKAALGVDGEEAAGVDGSRGLFALGQRRFGGPEYASRVEAAIQNVDGVIWCEVSALGIIVADDDNQTVDPTTLEMPAAIALSTTVACAADQVLRLHSVPGATNPLSIVPAAAPPNVGCDHG